MNVELQSLSSSEKGSFNQEVFLGAKLLEKTKQIFNTNFITGFPCGELGQFIDACDKDRDIPLIFTTNERESVGISAGAWLGEKTPTLFMQNSGFFEASNDVGSLLIACKIPALFIVSWRGAPGETATQHLATGTATTALLDAYHMPYIAKTTESNLSQLAFSLKKTNFPGCILLQRERFNEEPVEEKNIEENRTKGKLIKEETKLTKIDREEAISTILPLIKKDMACCSSTGLISRSIYHSFDSENQFYNAGALGLTSTIGLGFSLAKPDKKTVVIEGDGSVLSNLGNLNLIGHYFPLSFVHIILDNESFASCSNEPTLGSKYIPELASQLGYKRVYSLSSKEALEDVLKSALLTNDGPQMIHVRIKKGGERALKRPLEMSNIAERFRNHFAK